MKENLAIGFLVATLALTAAFTAPMGAMALDGAALQAGNPEDEIGPGLSEDDSADAFSTQSNTIVANGTWGTCPWEITDAGKLVVHPGVAGAEMYSPWGDYSSLITRIEFKKEHGNRIRLGEWSSINGLFCDLTQVKSMDLSGLDTSGADDMSSMFKNCKSLVKLNLSSFDTSNVKYMYGMFLGCSSLESLDISSFNLENCETCRHMLALCPALRSVTLGSNTSGADFCLPDAPDGHPFNGHWINVEGGPSYTSEELASSYDGNSMAGTYIWDYETWIAPNTIPDGEGIVKSKRLWGNTALDTMSAIVDEGGFAKGGVVVITTVNGYWDALTAASLAGLFGAPVLMTDGKSLSPQTRKQITKLAPKAIIACGGPAALSDKVLTQACDAAGGAESARCMGQTATGTAIDIFQFVPTEYWKGVAFVCTNDGYWDALAAAPISYAARIPIFLTEGSSSISAETINAMKDGEIKYVWIIGGHDAINDYVGYQLESAGIDVIDRLWGSTAVETSEEVARFGIDVVGMSADSLGVATVYGYWDALAGAALCGSKHSVLVLVDDGWSSSIRNFMSLNYNVIANMYIFGGTSAISKATENEAIRIAKTGR